LALLTIVHRHESLDNLLMLDRIRMRLILLDCVRVLLLLLMMLLALLLRGHPLKLDLHPAVIHDNPSDWGTSITSTFTLLVITGANLMHPPVMLLLILWNNPWILNDHHTRLLLLLLVLLILLSVKTFSPSSFLLT
jgi:hypothetical protein